MRTDPQLTVTEPSFGPTSGAFSGWAGEVIAVLVLGFAVAGHHGRADLAVGIGAVLAGVLIWAFLLRSRLVLGKEELLLRNAFSDTLVPYGLIDRCVVRSVTHVQVGKRRYVGVAVGRSLRTMARGRTTERNQPAESSPKGSLGSAQLADFVEEQVAARVREAAPGPAVVRRRAAVPEITATVVLLIALLAVLLI